MQKKAIMFGSIGTIVETSALQHAAFNEAFEQAGLDWSWDKSTYQDMLRKSGGEQRIADYAEEKGDDVDAAALHQRKTEIYNEKMKSQGLAPRKGVLALMQFAKAEGIKTGFATSTSSDNVAAIFASLDGALHRSDFDFVGDASKITNSKPDPEIYNVAMQSLNVTPAACLAIEDTAVSLKASQAAGIASVAFPGDYARLSDFDGDTDIVTDLDPKTLTALTQG